MRGQLSRARLHVRETPSCSGVRMADLAEILPNKNFGGIVCVAN